MTREDAALLVTAYICANVVLLPLLLIDLLFNVKRASIKLAVALHKLLAVLTVLLPLLLFTFSMSGTSPGAAAPWVRNVAQLAGTRTDVGVQVPDAPAGSASVVGEASQPRATRATVSGLAQARPTGAPRRDPVPTINDLAYYLCGLIVWLSVAGLAVFAARYFLQTVRVRRVLAASDAVEIRDGIAVARSRSAAAPFSVGLIVKRIVLPSSLEPHAADVVLRHELNHFECGHHLWSAVEALLAHAFWFNPVAHLLRRRGRFLRELECDARTIRCVDRFSYAGVLVESAERALAGCTVSPSGHAWVDRNGLRARIDFILGEAASQRRTAIRLTVIVGLVATVAILILVGNVNDRFLRDEILLTVNHEYAEAVDTRTATVELERVPDVFVQALLLYNDPGFYDHDGIDIRRRWNDGHLTMTTLTQQLARMLLDMHDRSIDRKLRELKVVRVLENSFTKDELLEMYLNTAFFGNRAYGLAEASMTYFDKPYTELTKAESAMLVPFLDAPSIANLRANPEIAAQKQRQLLRRMDELGPG